MTGQLSLLHTEQEQQEAKDAEFYRTPPHIVDQLVYTAPMFSGLPPGLWVEPGAGDGAIWSRMRSLCQGMLFHAVELRPVAVASAIARHGQDRVTHQVANWCTNQNFAPCTTAAGVVMNSPFSLTHEFVQRAFDRSPTAWVWSLQRQSWGKPAGMRTSWLMAHWPEFKLQCVGSRPSFTGDGRTDASEYIWYGWSPTGRNRDHCRWEGPCRETSET